VLRGDVLVFQLPRLVEGAVEDAREGGGDPRLLGAALNGGLAA
jgi:hypothetical protein